MAEAFRLRHSIEFDWGVGLLERSRFSWVETGGITPACQVQSTQRSVRFPAQAGLHHLRNLRPLHPVGSSPKPHSAKFRMK